MLSVRNIKIAAIFGEIILVMVAALAPLAVAKWQHKTSFTFIISLANSFGGGVFLAVGILHLLPEAVENLEKADIQFNLRVPFLLLMAGYLFVLLLEKVLFAHSHGGEDGHGHGDHGGEKQEHAAAINSFPDDFYVDQTRKHGHKKKDKWGVFNRVFAKTVKELDSSLPAHEDSHSEPLLEKEGAPHHHDKVNWKGVVGPIIMAVVLTIHSFFEGLLVGVQLNPTALLTLVVAVGSHKWVEALTLGLQLLKTKVKKRTFIAFITVFALLNPLGIMVGIFVTEWVTAKATTYFSAFACGSFLYIGATEVIAEEFGNSKWRWFKYFGLMLGCFVIGILNALVPD